MYKLCIGICFLYKWRASLGNNNKLPVYFNLPSNYTIYGMHAKSVIKSSGNEKMLMNVMTELAHSM
jgi:hypothetical protein